MPTYTPPVRDISFALVTIADLESIVALPDFDHVDPDMIDGVLEEAARFFSEVFAPTNEIGDQVGAALVDGVVVTPEEFKPVWGKLVDAGWTAVTGSPEYGGHGFPKTIGMTISEMMTSANLAFSLNPMLTGSGIALLTHHGGDELRDLYLAKLISSEWTGTMVLTEPGAGSDVGAVTTKAVPLDERSSGHQRRLSVHRPQVHPQRRRLAGGTQLRRDRLHRAQARYPRESNVCVVIRQGEGFPGWGGEPRNAVHVHDDEPGKARGWS